MAYDIKKMIPIQQRKVDNLQKALDLLRSEGFRDDTQNVQDLLRQEQMYLRNFKTYVARFGNQADSLSQASDKAEESNRISGEGI